ncbi:MAG: btuB 3 [Verrucomicrobia bacterium]|nr:btuB 3 [Verrucomicrobiota bacterium]
MTVSFRSRCLLSFLLLASARGQLANDVAVRLDPVSVTGSHLRRTDEEKVLPVTILGREAIDLREAGQPSDLLTALPMVTGLPLNETATLGAQARGDDAAISLRGLPSGDTLILLNGRRLAPHPISTVEGSVPSLSVNVNQLPNRGIDRVEVLRDGASSVYGSDAVAGVVNYVMRSDFRGTELALRFGQTQDGDGAESRATLTHGFDFAGGRGRFFATLDLYDRAAIYARDRAFSAESDFTNRAPAPWNDLAKSTAFFSRSSTSAYGNYSLGTLNGDGSFTASRPAGIPASLVATSGQFFLVPTSGGTGFKTTTPGRTGVERDYYWNNNAYRVIQPESKRVNWFNHLEYDLNDRVTFFSDLSWYRARSLADREPDGITASTDGNIVVPATNPYNPFGTRFWDPAGAPNADGTPRLTGTPASVVITNKRLSDLATRTATVTDSVYRGVAGLRGKLAGSWGWETALLYSRARVTDAEAGTDRKSLLQQAINQGDLAKAYNPFGYAFAVQNGTLAVTGPATSPPSVVAGFRDTFVRDGITKLGSGDIRVTGELAELWSGNIAAGAVGGEYRYEGYDDYRPPYAGLNPAGSGLDPASNDFLGFSPNSDTHAHRDVAAIYAEAMAPLVGRSMEIPGVESLEFSVAVRHERYSDFGSTTKPKYGVNWRLAPWALVRASYNQGFHAPNLAEVFTGSLVRTATNTPDAYRGVVTGLPTDGSSNRRSVSSGNLTLKPESSIGRSAGVVVDLSAVKGLSVSVDYWEIQQKDVISGPTATDAVNSDRDALAAATQAQLAAGTAIGQVNLGSGTANYLGDPAVARLPVTQADRDFFTAYNFGRPADQQRAVVGAIDLIRLTYFNKARQFVNGVDFDLNWRMPPTQLGQFTFDSAWTYLIDFYSYDAPGKPKAVLRGQNSFAAGGAAIWRGTTTLTWKRGQWGAGLGAYYVGRYEDSNATTTQGVYQSLGSPNYIAPVYTNGAWTYRYVVHDRLTYNAYVTYRIQSKQPYLNDTTVRVGVVNLFDADPPLSSDSRGYDPGVYNVLARGLAWSLQLTKKF